MTDDRKTPWLALAALSLITAYGLWQIAIRQPDRVQVRIIDLPQATPAALLTSGIDRQTLSEYLEQTSVEVPYGPVTAYASQPSRTRISSSIAIETDQEVIPPVPAGRTKPLSAGSKGPNNHRALKVTVTATPKGWIPVEISVYSAKYHNGPNNSYDPLGGSVRSLIAEERSTLGRMGLFGVIPTPESFCNKPNRWLINHANLNHRVVARIDSPGQIFVWVSSLDSYALFTINEPCDIRNVGSLHIVKCTPLRGTCYAQMEVRIGAS